jgi:exosortase
MSLLAGNHANGAAWLLSMAVAWIWTLVHLEPHWRVSDAYSYAYGVPIMALYLAWTRRREWRVPDSPSRDTERLGWMGTAVMAGCLPVFWLAELFRQQDPMWRLGGWFSFGAALILTSVWLLCLGGPRLLGSFRFPLLFLCLALPWPSALEGPVTQGLLGIVTAVSVDLLNWLEIPAVQYGNMIQLAKGWAGMDVACSGIQSLQSSLMASLFLGALFRISIRRRLLLVALGSALAMAGNLLRVLTLARLVSREGESAVDTYHQGAGAAASAAIFLCLALTAWIMARNNAQGNDVAPSGGGDAVRALQLPGRLGFVLIAGLASTSLVAMGVMTAGGASRIESQPRPLWRLSADRLDRSWQASPDSLTSVERRILGFSKGSALTVRTPEGKATQVMHLFWSPELTPPSHAFIHSPELCMLKAGWTFLGQPEPVEIGLSGRKIPGVAFRFHSGEGYLSVFQFVWRGGRVVPFGHPPTAVPDRLARFKLLWTEPRLRGQEIIAFYLPGRQASVEEAALLEQVLGGTITPAR